MDKGVAYQLLDFIIRTYLNKWLMKMVIYLSIKGKYKRHDLAIKKFRKGL